MCPTITITPPHRTAHGSQDALVFDLHSLSGGARRNIPICIVRLREQTRRGLKLRTRPHSSEHKGQDDSPDLLAHALALFHCTLGPCANLCTNSPDFWMAICTLAIPSLFIHVQYVVSISAYRIKVLSMILGSGG